MTYIVTYAPFPFGGMASTSRICCYAKSILEGGEACKILCYKRTEVAGKPSRNNTMCGLYEGVPFVYIPNTNIRSKYVISRKVYDIYDRYHLIQYLKKILCPRDKVILYLLDDTRYIVRLTKIIQARGAYSVLELCEIPFVGFDNTVGDKRRSKVYEKVFTRIDGCIAISRSLEQLVKQYKKETCEVITIPILVDYAKFAYEDLSINSDFPYIFHAGSLYERKDGIVGMLRAFALSIDRIPESTQFLMTGYLSSTPDQGAISDIIKNNHLEKRVKFLGYLSEPELHTVLQYASLVIVNKYDTLQNRYCFSTKLGEYLAASKPVIVTNVGEVVNWISDGVNGLIVEPHDEYALSNAIIRLLNDENLHLAIGKQGRILCQQYFAYSNYKGTLCDFLNRLHF